MPLDVSFRSKKIEKICTDASRAEREYGIIVAVKIQQRIDEIQAADSIEQLLKYKIGRCHQLLGNRKGQYAMDLGHPLRLVFIVDKNGIIQVAEIIEIVDYH